VSTLLASALAIRELNEQTACPPRALIDACQDALGRIIEASRSWPLAAIVGMPIPVDHLLYNCAVVLHRGRILGVVPKTYLPNYREFYEARHYLRVFDEAMPRYGITVSDRELACAPFRSPEGRACFAAMAAAANTAFANRQVITHRVRELFARVFGRDARALGLEVIYDVCHNTAKLERHRIDGEWLELVVYRKGATPAFGPGAPDIPAAYRDVGQPVIIGGSMESGSALLVGASRAMAETFGSTAHGAGRTMSRAQAKKRV